MKLTLIAAIGKNRELGKNNDMIWHLPQDLKYKFTDDDLYYILDLIVEYYTTSGCLDAQPDEEGYINIDQDEIVDFIVKEAAKNEMGPYDPEDVFFVVQGEMEYGNQLGEVE